MRANRWCENTEVCSAPKFVIAFLKICPTGMETIAIELANLLLDKLRLVPNEPELQPAPRILVAICGVPASGKTTLALRVTELVNSKYGSVSMMCSYPGTCKQRSQLGDLLRCPYHQDPKGREVAICVSQDGWHLPRSALDQMDDPKLAHDRRGAAFTFDGGAFAKFVLSLRNNSVESTIVDAMPDETSNQEDTALAYRATKAESILYAPSFSHTLKDPTENAIAIHPHHRVVIIEGLYSFLSIEPWREASLVMDERWFVDADKTIAKDRLVRRHVVTGVAKDLEEAEWRAENNDIPNGEFLKEHMLQPTRVIQSVKDTTIASHGRIE
ncbi:P-loop containing nucleoside triphosphate hydrolase protein [Clavulina sp. PMI_390]|nr:P-loop containing nucleoside triphosphate hydrolase protein [Clavulina sp. PMI_390]